MILKRPRSANPWSPSGFARYREDYPNTGWTPPPKHLDRTPKFVAMWPQAASSRLPSEVAIVLTPGLFAEWLPACFRAAERAFLADSHRVKRTRVHTSRGIRAQAAVLTEELLAWLSPGERFVWCTHSKGGLDALWSIETNVLLRQRCAALVIVQPPVGRSWIVERCLHAPETRSERWAGWLFRRRFLRDGLSDISLARDSRVTDWLGRFVPPLPMLHAVSWSVRPTSWVDAYHNKLARLRPGHAHDGQFYLGDQRLPATPIVCLPELDHAQPVLGGHGFDVARLWRALAACVWQDVEPQTR